MKSILLSSALAFSAIANEFSFDYSTCHKISSCSECMNTVNDKPLSSPLDGSKCIPTIGSNSCETWWDVEDNSYTVDYSCNQDTLSSHEK